MQGIFREKTVNAPGKNCSLCGWLRFLFGSCIHDPPFAKTRLTAQTLRSVAEISTNLSAKASPLPPSLQFLSKKCHVAINIYC